MPKKLTYEFVRDYINSTGEVLQSTIYVNSRTKLKIRCKKCNEDYFMVFGNFKKGHRCYKCGIIKTANSNRKSYDDVKRYIEDTGEILLSKEYNGIYEKLKIKCRKNNHIYYLRWTDFQQGRRCSVCYKENNKKENHSKWKGGVSEKNISLYDTYAPQIDWCEEVRRDPKNPDYLQVKCTESSCRKWFNPKITEVCKRRDSINGKSSGECRFYCSEECKKECICFDRNKYIKGFNKFADYKRSVINLSNKNYKKYIHIINPFNLNRSYLDYHLDHIYSIVDGFENNISIDIISCPINLRMLKSNKNMKKHSSSEFIKEEIYELYNQFTKEILI